ncbi:MAG: TorF family putative porin [Pseudomonadota bacterium]
MKKNFLLAIALATAFLALPCHAAPPAEPTVQSYSLDFEIKAMTDRRNRGVSDSYNNPAMEFTVNAAHESGLVGLLQIGSASQTVFPSGNGTSVLGAVGYRRGDPERFHYGFGVAKEWFPGAHVEAPTGVDWETTGATGVPTFTGLSDTKFDTSYLVVELGWGMVEARYLYVLSNDFRGNNTATLCGSTYLTPALMGGDPTQAINCYGSGPRQTGGSHLLDLDIKYPLSGQTKLVAHLGYQSVKNFSDIDGWDYRLGVVHTRWGVDFSADVVGAALRNRDFANVPDSSGNTRRIDSTTLVLGVAKRF